MKSDEVMFLVFGFAIGFGLAVFLIKNSDLGEIQEAQKICDQNVPRKARCIITIAPPKEFNPDGKIQPAQVLPKTN